MTDKRNPWLILGMDYRGPAQDVVAHMAAKLRALRQLDRPPFNRDDIVWASGKAKKDDVDHCWRVPAGSWPPDPPNQDTGLFRPEPAALERRTEPISQVEVDDAATAAIRSFLRQVAEEYTKMNL